MNMPDVNNRLKGLRIPIELAVKYERMAGVKLNEKPTRHQAESITKMMIAALYVGAVGWHLTPEDYEQIAQEKRKNASKR